MTTTQVFIELLMTGFGCLVWLILIYFGINGLELNYLSELKISNAFILPIAGIAYILGIIIDRIGYQIFKRKERKNINKVFDEVENRASVQFKEVFIIQNSDHLRSAIKYNRSRLRLCRSWIINFLMISLSLILYLIVNYNLNLTTVYFLLVVNIIFCLLSFYTWNKLACDYYKNIKSSFENLQKL